MECKWKLGYLFFSQRFVILNWVFIDIFSKMNKVSLLLQENQVIVCMANDKIQAFTEMLNFGKYT